MGLLQGRESIASLVQQLTFYDQVKGTTTRRIPMKISSCSIVVSTLVTLALSQSALGISNGTAPAEGDTRFDAVGALSYDHYLGQDEAGNNLSDNYWFCTAVLVAPNTILTAAHCGHNDGRDNYMVRFRRQVDGTLGTLEAGAESYYHARVVSWDLSHADTDFVIGYLEDDVSHISPIPTITRGHQNMVDTPFLHAGWGLEAPNGSQRELLLCDNRVRFTHEGTVLTLMGLANHCGVQMHDSGSPLLVEDGGGDLRVIALTTSPGFGVSTQQFDGTTEVVHTPFEGVDFNIEAEMVTQSVAPGALINFDAWTANHGTLSAKARVRPQWVRGEDVIDMPLMSVSPRTGWSALKNQIAVPSLPEPATYQLALTIDPSDRTEEAIESNNTVQLTTHVTVTSVHSDVKQEHYFIVYRDGMMVGDFMGALRADGSMTLLGGLYGATSSLGLEGQYAGQKSFQNGGVVFSLKLVNGAPTLVTSTAGIEIVAVSEDPTVGAAGHLQGVYKGFVVTETSGQPQLKPVLAQIRGGGGMKFGGGGMPFEGYQGANGEDNTLLSSGLIEDGDFIWDSKRQTFRLNVTLQDGYAVLYLQTR
jgi:hypothetical protein